MASTCISSCTDTVDHRGPRASYASLHKWPESDAEFVRSINPDAGGGGASRTVVDSISCRRQKYLRSYTFTREQTLPQKTNKWFHRVRVLAHRGDRDCSVVPSSTGRAFWNSRAAMLKSKAVDLSCSAAALWDVLRRLLACSTKVDAVDHGDR